MSVDRNPSSKILAILLLSVIIFGSVAVYYGLAFNAESGKVAELQNMISRSRNQNPVTNHVVDTPARYDVNMSVSAETAEVGLSKVANYSYANLYR